MSYSRRDRSKPRSAWLRRAWIAISIIAWILVLMSVWSFYAASRH